jgi:hypothetical protein
VWPARLYGHARAGGGPAPQLQLQAGRRRAQSRLLGRRQQRDRVPPQSGLGRACRGCHRGKLCRSRGVGTTHQGWHLGRRSAIAPRGSRAENREIVGVLGRGAGLITGGPEAVRHGDRRPFNLPSSVPLHCASSGGASTHPSMRTCWTRVGAARSILGKALACLFSSATLCWFFVWPHGSPEC